MGDVATKIPARKESLKGLAGKALHKHCILQFWQGANLILLMGSYPIQCSLTASAHPSPPPSFIEPNMALNLIHSQG